MRGVRVPDRWLAAYGVAVQAALIDRGFITTWPHEGRFGARVISTEAQSLYRSLIPKTLKTAPEATA